jgi:hypothetical protein
VGFSRGIAIVDGELKVVIDLFEKRKLSKLVKAVMSIDKRGFRTKLRKFGTSKTALKNTFQ